MSLIFGAAVSSVEVLTHPAPAMREGPVLPGTNSNRNNFTREDSACSAWKKNTPNKTVVAVSRGLDSVPHKRNIPGTARSILMICTSCGTKAFILQPFSFPNLPHF